LAQQTLGDLHAAYPTLVISEPGQVFAEWFLEDLRRIAPRLPVAVHSVDQGAPDETMLGAKAVLIPVGVVLTPSESLKLWLGEYHGHRLLIPLEKEGYLWLGLGNKAPQELARESAQTVRQLAEGEALRQALPNSPWAIAGYILGGLLGLQLVIVLLSLMISALFR
jgi:hypothetical protein